MKNNIYVISLTVLLSVLVIPRSGFAIQHEQGDENQETDCFVDKGLCVKTLRHKNMQVTFAIDPKPVKTMKELLFTVNLKESGMPIPDADVTLDLTMPGMFMGINRPPMNHIKDGVYEGKGVIPVCPHGGKIWKADVTVKRDGGSETASFVFEVK